MESGLKMDVFEMLLGACHELQKLATEEQSSESSVVLRQQKVSTGTLWRNDDVMTLKCFVSKKKTNRLWNSRVSYSSYLS